MNRALSIENEYLRRYPVEVAAELERLPTDELGATASHLDTSGLAVAMEHLSLSRNLDLFGMLAPEAQVIVLEKAASHVAVGILAGLSEASREALLKQVRSAARNDLRRLLAFPENTAGRLMERTFVGARIDMTVAEALQRLRDSSIRRARSLYVMTPDQRLAGRVEIQDLALADADEPLRGLMQSVDDVVKGLDSREEVVELLDRSRLDSVPVIDADGRLLGVVRYRTLFQAIEDVATGDIQKMVGVSIDERALSSPGFSIRRRLPWLHINLLTAFLAASVVGLFENLIAQFTALAVLLPVVAGQSGNAGSQALAVTIRGLALKEVGLREWHKVLNKEVRVGLFNGVALALSCGAAVFLWSSSIGLALIIAVAMVLSMVAAGISGALVPILLTRFGQDPATASAIILTTVTDVCGFFAFLGTASLLAFMI